MSNNTKPTQLGPTGGLSNYGNFCYLNSSIQCLRVLSPIIQFINSCTDQTNIICDILKRFNTLELKNTEANKLLYRTVAWYLHNYYMDNPDDDDPYVNPDDGRVIALEDIFGKNPPSDLIPVKPNVATNTINLINTIQKDHNMTRQHMYDTIRKLALHIDKIYVFITLRALLISLDKAATGECDSIINPVDVISTLHMATKHNPAYSHLCNGQQNDAFELIIVLLDYIHDAQAYNSNLDIPNDILSMKEDYIKTLSYNEQITVGVCQAIHNRYAKNYTLMVDKLFFYTLRVIRCGNKECNNISLAYEPNNVLSVPIYIDDLAQKVMESNNDIMTSNSNHTSYLMKLRQTAILNYRKLGNRRNIELDAEPVSIYDCLDNYFKRDKLDDYKCEKCDNKHNNSISQGLVNLPNALIINLKRFQTIDNLGQRAKVYRRVTYPLQLDISKYCASPVSNGVYKLVAVTLHLGGVDGGHYTAITFNKNLNCWFLYNDEHVTQLQSNVDALNNQNAYILFYEKI